MDNLQILSTKITQIQDRFDKQINAAANALRSMEATNNELSKLKGMLAATIDLQAAKADNPNLHGTIIDHQEGAAPKLIESNWDAKKWEQWIVYHNCERFYWTKWERKENRVYYEVPHEGENTKGYYEFTPAQPSGNIEQLKTIVQELETCSHQWERQNSGSILIHNICTKCKTENFG